MARNSKGMWMGLIFSCRDGFGSEGNRRPPGRRVRPRLPESEVASNGFRRIQVRTGNRSPDSQVRVPPMTDV